MIQEEPKTLVQLLENMEIDCAAGELVFEKRLNRLSHKLKNGEASLNVITAEVLKTVPEDSKMKLARSLSRNVLDHEIPRSGCSQRHFRLRR